METAVEHPGVAAVRGVPVRGVPVQDLTVQDVTVQDVTVQDVTVQDVAVEDVAVEVSGYDRDAEFAAFMTGSAATLGRIALLLTGDMHRAEELLQATLVRTYVSWHRARDGEPLAYARRILANQRIDTWRRHRREVLTEPTALPEAPVAAHADQHADRDHLVRALRTLPARRRRVVVLRYLVGLTEAEVAHDLGVSVGTVKSTAARGLAQLRTDMGAGLAVPPTKES